MVDQDALKQLIRADSAARGTTISKLGYFCAPFQPRTGPFRSKVIKIYQSLSDHGALDQLAKNHTDYVAILHKTGVGLPETEFLLLEMDGRRFPVIVQEALDSNALMRPLMINASHAQALQMLNAAGQVIARFWNNLSPEDGRVGFHPSIRNFAIVQGKAVFFDTFPPLIHYTRDDMGKLLLQFSENRLMRLMGPILQRKVTGIQDEWYSPPETLIGLVGSACRLRPAEAAAFLDWGRAFAADEMAQWSNEIHDGLTKPPRLPGYWTGFRKLLGLQGEPNI